MGLFHKKKKKEEDDLLKEIEAEEAKITAAPPALPMPPAPKPAPKPLPPLEKPALSTEQVAKLPLFMKVKEYDKIIKELKNLTQSLKNMEGLLNQMVGLEKEEDTATKRWREQLELTKVQVQSLVTQLPETGQLRDVLKVQKKTEEQDKLKKEIDILKKDLQTSKQTPPRPDLALKVSNEVGGLKNSITGLQDEIRHLHAEFKMLNTLTQMKSSTAVKDIKKDIAPKPEEKKPTYKKGPIKSPW